MVNVVCKPCICCGKRAEVQLTDREYFKWSNGLPLDVAVPRLSMDDRELLITGTHAKCWETMFPEEAAEGLGPDCEPDCEECAKHEAFLDDPITVAYGVGSEMAPLFKHDCPRVN